MSEELDKVRRYTNGGGFRDMKGGALDISKPGQEILEQNSILIHEGNIEARLTFGLPGHGNNDGPSNPMRALVHMIYSNRSNHCK